MNLNSTQTHPPLASRSGAEASDPVLAALPTRFSFGEAGGVGIARILIALLGAATAVAGIVVIVGGHLHVAVGVGLLVVGALMIAPLLGKVLLPSKGHWSEMQTGGAAKLSPIRFGIDGDDEQAAELFRTFTTEPDSERWPQLDLQLQASSGIVVTIYRRAAGDALLTLRTESDSGARSWPLIETAADVTSWLRRIAPKPDSSSDQAANAPYLYE